jgi:phage baseplate assembly protein gpV
MGLVEEVYPHADSGDSDNYGCDVKLKNSGLLLKRVPVATGHIGTAAIPNIGDLVVLSFYHGDINQAVIVGRLYNDEDRPPLNRSDEVVFRLPLAAPDDDTIQAAIRNLRDNNPPREILVEMPPKITVRITDGAVRATAGKTEMLLDQPGGSGGKVTVLAGNTRITMNQDGDISVEARGSMKLEAAGDFKLQAQSVSIESRSSIDVKAAASATIKANAQATLQASGAATVQAATVQIKGVTSFSP